VHKIRRLLAGRRYHVLHLCQATLALIYASASLRLFGYGSTLRHIQASCRLRQAMPAGLSYHGGAPTLVRAVHIVMRLAPQSITCLPRSCALFWLLAWHGFNPRICFGVQIREHGIEAHAWVELDGVALGEPADVRDLFRPLRGTDCRRSSSAVA